MRPIAVFLAGLVTSASAAPRLHVSTPSLTPESTIELILDSPVAGPDRIGKEVKTPWLDIQPAWRGTSHWKEANVIEFRPATAPALGTTYVFKLTGKHAHLDGTAIPTGELARIASEPFQVDYATIMDRYVDGWSPRTATYFVRFNAEVSPEKAAPFLVFESPGTLHLKADAEGYEAPQRVAAKVERATFGRLKQPGYLGLSWSERFDRRGQPRQEPGADGLTPQTELPTGLLVTPAQPLPTGKGWRLQMLAGLPDASGKATLPVISSRHVGDIEPLRVEELIARVIADEPRRIVADLNAKLPVDLPASMVSVTPEPANLRVEVRGDELHVFGDFSGDGEWVVTLQAGLTSADGRPLGQAYSKAVTFLPLKPELALPSQDESQLASGNRKYRVQTVNLAGVKVRVKRLNAEQLIRAQQGYRHYTGVGPDGKELKPTHLIPYEMLAGETVAELEIPFTNALDTTQPLMLDWDQVLAGAAQPYRLGQPKAEEAVTPAAKMPAAFFIEVAGTPKPGITRLADEDEDGEPDPVKSPVAQALIQLTDLGLAWKVIDGEARVLAFSCLTGKPLPGVNLTSYGEDAKPLQQAVTGPDGMAVLPREATARHLQANLGDDRYSVAYDNTLPTVGLWRFPVRYSWEKTPVDQRRLFLFTDRSLYRPGETVHLKGILRHQKGNDIVADVPQPAELVVTDPRNKEILRREIQFSAAGGFDADIELPAENTGYHRVRVEFPAELAKLEETENWSERSMIQRNASFHHGFSVEEFRRNAFELTLATDPPALGAAEVTAQLRAAYYQGQPVAKGEVQTFTTVSESNFYPEKFRDHLFGDHRTQDFNYWYHYFGYRWDDDHGSDHSESNSEKSVLAEDGTARITARLPEGDFPRTREVEISTEVTDSNRQTLVERTRAVVHPASAYVGVQRLDRLVRAGDRIPLGIVAVTPAGEPYPGELKVEARLSREVNEQVRLGDEDGGSAVRNESRREELSTTALTLADGQGTEFLFAPQQPGLHQIELRGTDPEGRAFATVMSVHVYGGDEYPWAYEDGVRIKLVPEKKLYQPGDTARVLVLSPIEGTALVTVEREKVLRSFTIELKADKPVIDIPLTDADAPNTYVSVLVIKGAQDSARQFKEPQLRLGYCELTVRNRRDTLAVTLDVPQDSVPPGTEVPMTGTIVLADGTPAADAEVTLYAEDEGTLAVMGYRTPDPMAHFYDPRELRVDCGTTLDRFVAESPEEQTFYNKGFFVGGGDGDFGGPPPALRRDFNPCAGWMPALKTDAAGKFTATFKMPDTLTRYRVIAVAHHGASRFGHAEAALTVSQPLMVEPQAPRFANEGDRLDIRALVQNASEFTGTWKITFTPNPPSSAPIAVHAGAEHEKTLTLAPGASAPVVFPVDFQETGEAVISWTAVPVSIEGGELTPVLASRLSDRVESRFQVNYPVPLLRQARLVKVDGQGANLLQGLDPDLLRGRGRLELEISRSLLLEAAGSVDYLLQYPYGCLEQTTSSMMPWLAVEQLRGVVPAFSKYTQRQVRDALQKGANRLILMQQSNGSFSYWPGQTESVDWATSYAGLGLVLAKQAGASVPAESIDQLCRHLEESLRGIGTSNRASDLESACRAVWVLTLAGRESTAIINSLLARMDSLTPAARCMLALAAQKSGTGNPAGILRDKTKFALKDDHWMSLRNDASLTLLAWSAVDSEAPEATAALEKLIQERNPYGHWGTTWVNAWSLLAMAAYAEHHDEATPATVTLTTADGARQILVEPGKPAVGLDFPLGGSLALSASSDQPAYIRVKLASKPDLAPQKPVAKNGLEITRYYERVNADGTTEPLDRPRPGDLVRVTLKLALPFDDARYLVVEDCLPSIFEAVNDDFASQSARRPGVRDSTDSWSISHSELRSDRALFFYDRIWRSGRHEITYLARCTMEGKAIAPPAKIESMYQPDQVALSASREF
jgi:uncharacterized protein YfaS (alpha-2-macroglobulin family)